jgi:hypothetical protein
MDYKTYSAKLNASSSRREAERSALAEFESNQLAPLLKHRYTLFKSTPAQMDYRSNTCPFAGPYEEIIYQRTVEMGKNNEKLIRGSSNYVDFCQVPPNRVV